jgi:hypothetical protein
MPITKNGNGVIVETPPEDLDQFLRTGVMNKDGFAVADYFDRTKQIKFDPSAQDPDTSVTLKSGASTSNVTITLPATTGTLALAGESGGGNSFGTIQPDAGTSPAADQTNDVLTLAGGTHVTTTGDSATDTIVISTDATNANTAGTIVARDGSGNFSAGTITANLAGNADTVTTNANLTGDVTSVGNATTIGAGKVTSGMLAGSIAASKLVGTDIATVGTVTAGTWNANKVTEAYGGTNQSTYAAGDILHCTSTNTLGKLAIGTQGQMPVVQSTGLLAYQDRFDPSNVTEWCEDFVGGPQIAGWILSNASQDNPQPDVSRRGVIYLSTTTSSSGNGSVVQNYGNYWFGQGSVDIEVAVYFPTASDGTNRYTWRFGIMNALTGAALTDGCWIEYCDNVNSGNFTLNAAKASVTTTTNSSTAPAFGSLQWRIIRISVNAAANLATFYINTGPGTSFSSIGTVTTNIPVAKTVTGYYGSNILKSAGTSTRVVYVDWFKYRERFTNPR